MYYFYKYNIHTFIFSGSLKQWVHNSKILTNSLYFCFIVTMKTDYYTFQWGITLKWMDGRTY